MSPQRKLRETMITWITQKLLKKRSRRAAEKSKRSEYQIIGAEIPTGIEHGWQDPGVASGQQVAFDRLLQKMREGKPRQDFLTLAEAVKKTGLADPLIIEVGCGSGWNSEVMAHLLKRPIRYIGMDYSESMVLLGRQAYPRHPFLVGDATLLPFADRACDILLSGGVLMHLTGYRQAIRESRRVAARWCIFHTIPVLQRRATTVLQKKAYDQSTVVEVIFNEVELFQMIKAEGMKVRLTLDNLAYNLQDVLGEPTAAKTYLCEVVP